jgi:transposase InsO family protein
VKERVKFLLEWERRWKEGEGRPDVDMPASSTIGEVLRRRGLTTNKIGRPRDTKEARAPFADVACPNATWCVDFKGHFRLGNGQKGFPLTIIDAYSRYLLRCEGVLEPDGREVQRIFDSAFQEYGLPATIRSDNGPPFATVGAGGLSKLSVWWIKLGVRVERITPGKPQENGRQERFHRTLKAETATPRTRISAHSSAHSMPSAASTTSSDPMKLLVNVHRRRLTSPPLVVIRDRFCDSLSTLATKPCESPKTVRSSG